MTTAKCLPTDEKLLTKARKICLYASNKIKQSLFSHKYNIYGQHKKDYQDKILLIFLDCIVNN